MAFITDEHVSPPLENSLQVLVPHILYTIVKRIMVIIQKKIRVFGENIGFEPWTQKSTF